ncbi:Uncharacterized protein HZ326_27814 [Fusarium oxysporum f. sp. albedinis]|nr:Uncharacterized protein HZ326_27814 [Fusarium oxysporum f. sp. albedinis]
MPNSRKLSNLEEDTLLKFIFNLDSRGYPPRLSGVKQMANQLFDARDAPGYELRQATTIAQDTNWYQECNLLHDWAVITTQNGWTDNDTGIKWLKHFDQCKINRLVSTHRLLILDGHESHHSVDFELYCQEKKIITLYIPPHSSHLLQPLNVRCFRPLKKAYGREIEQFIRKSVTYISKTEFFLAFHAAFQATMTESNIEGGFRGAGLVPRNPESVFSKLDVQLRTSTPVEEEASASTSWVPKTSKTVREVESQSEYLERRIRRHKSSSPESIIRASRSLAKAATKIYHKPTPQGKKNPITERRGTNSRGMSGTN